jgi:hypothetical protein
MKITKVKAKGFHGKQTGWKAYQWNEHSIVFDAFDDIVWTTNPLLLTTFDGNGLSGAYYRVFSPFGSSTVFAENMYFTPTLFEPYLL